MRLFCKSLLEFEKAVSRTYASATNSVAQSKEMVEDSRQSKQKKRAAVQNKFVADAKKTTTRQKRERKETKLAKKHHMEFSQSFLASQAQSFSALHAIANSFFMKIGGQPLPQPQILAPLVLPIISL